MTRLFRTLSIVVVIVGGLTATSVVPASAGLSDRACWEAIDNSPNRRLSICARTWVSDSGPLITRSVVEMHFYIRVNGQWVDATAKSLTINSMSLQERRVPGGAPINQSGQDIATNSCRVNSPSGSQITCSVPNAGRVAYYGRYANQGNGNIVTCIRKFSWRDDLNKAWVWTAASYLDYLCSP